MLISKLTVRPCQGGVPHVARLNLKRLVTVFINACRLLSVLSSLSRFGRGRLSLVMISFYALSLLFGPCHLSEFTLAGPQSAVNKVIYKVKRTRLLSSHPQHFISSHSFHSINQTSPSQQSVIVVLYYF